MKRRVERALVYSEKFFGDLTEALRDGVAVTWSEGDDLEDQHVESAAEEFGFGFVHCYT